MADGTIEILGQKFSYPTSWHGTAAVLVVFTSLVAVIFIASTWATPEVLGKIKDIANYSNEQDKTIEKLVGTVSMLNNKLGELEGKISKDVTSDNSSSEKEIKSSQLKGQIDISKLREQLAAQNLFKSKAVAPLVSPNVDMSSKIQQFQEIQDVQQKIQQDLSYKLQQLQATP